MSNSLKATIIGWYGTETIGDRAILAGIVAILSKVAKSVEISIGSLFPILTERTIREDSSFFTICAKGCPIKFDIFDSKDKSALNHSIRNSMVTIIGGGPLMDICEMSMLDYAFSYAKKHKKKTIICGCGYGPLNNNESFIHAKNIIDSADLSIMRDSYSPISTDYSSIDPAIFACKEFLSVAKKKDSDYYVVNLRDVSLEGNHYVVDCTLENRLTDFVSSLSEILNKPILLVPMHSFSVGGDDREILWRIKHKINCQNIQVVSTPPSLFQTMELFHNAAACVGMRFHAVLLQTLLNGKNIILDYTHPMKGKIINLFHQLNMERHYQSQYFSLFDNNTIPAFNLDAIKQFQPDWSDIERTFDVYVSNIKKILFQ